MPKFVGMARPGMRITSRARARMVKGRRERCARRFETPASSASPRMLVTSMRTPRAQR